MTKAKVNNTIELGIVENVNHESDHLGEAFGISLDRIKTIKAMCLEIAERNDIRVSEVLCEVATQFKGNELLYALFIMGELRARACSSRGTVIPMGSDMGKEIQKVLDRLLKGEKD